MRTALAFRLSSSRSKLLHQIPFELQPAWTASLSLREPLAAFLNDIAGKFKRVVVIHDSMMAAMVQDVASIPNAESYALNCIFSGFLLRQR
ncbi:hypothetical protein C2S51_015300 [Perilla frutescens var. frutescens]|nr:hypothetical protein C2S51_015300 [Perilla frutescens var. frutescens]